MNVYDFLGFNRIDIENLLGINLHDNTEEHDLNIRSNLDKWLIPYLSRSSLLLTDTAFLIIGVKPNTAVRGIVSDELQGYIYSLWDAVDNGKLTVKSVSYYDNYDGDRKDGVLVRSEVELWVKEHGFSWPLPMVHREYNDKKISDSKIDTPTQWGEFAGKETALLFIAGLATALEKAGGKYSRGGKPNKLSIAKCAIDAINDYGKGTMLTSRALTELLTAALDVNLTKLDG